MSGRRTGSAAQLAALAAALALVAGSTAAAAGPGAGYRAKAHQLNVEAQKLDTRTHKALLDLYALESRLGAAQTRLTALETQSAQLRERRRALAQQLAAARATLAVSQQNLGAHLRGLYEQGGIDPLAVILGARSLDDALSRLDDLKRLADQNRQMVVTTTIAQTRLARVRSTLAAEQRRLDRSVTQTRSAAHDLTTARSQRLDFVSGLRRQQQLKDAQIRSLLATAKAVEAKAATLQAPTTTASAPAASTSSTLPPALSQGDRILVVSATGYSLPGHTATGLPVGWGIVAVDPSVIPLGTRMTVPGYGDAVAADVGSAVRGADIDLWFPTLAEAQAWGRRTVTIVLHQ